MSTLGVDRLGEVVEQSASEIYVFAADDFRFILVNRGARENLGYSLAELSEMHPWDLKPEFSEEEFKAFVGPLLSAEVPRLSFETVHGRKDGSTYEVSVSLQLIQSQGEFVFFAAIRDISEFNSIRDRLERTSSRLDAILNNTRMAIFMMDEQQNCSFMNRAAEELTGYSFEEAVGRCLHGLIHHQYPDGSPFPIEECPIDRAFPERHQISGEDMFVHKDGNFYNVSYTASPMVDSSGSTVGTIVEAFNIDAVVAARDELAKSHRRLERSVRTFQQAEKIAKLGSWEFDVETQSLTFSDQAYKIMGLDQQRPMTLDDMTRGQVEDTIEFLSDPKNRERAAEEYARRNGTSIADGRAEMDWFHTYLATKLAIADGTATPEQIAWMEQQDANPETAGRVARAYETTHALGADTQADQAATLSVGDAQTVVANASTGDAANDDAVAANIDDDSVWLAAREAQGSTDEEIADFEAARDGASDSMAFLGGEREGPIVSPDFNATAAGSQQLAQAQAPSQVGPSSTSEFGLG